MRIVVADKFAEQRLGDAELRVDEKIGILGIVDLGDQHLEPRLVDQRMQVRGAVRAQAVR